MKHFSLTCAALVFVATSSFAQTYPEPSSTTVNDFADMISPEAEARIVEKLETLASDGTEMTVATLSSLRFYANETDIGTYANGLFNEWGIGDPEKGDGVLLLIFRDDGLLRIETGPFYDEDRQFAAQNVIGDVMVPEFQAGAFEAGIEKGVDALIPALTATAASAPTASGDADSKGSGNTLWYILGAIVVAIGGIFGLNKRAKAKLAATPCPNCGKTGTLSKSSVVLTEATLEAAGNGERRTTCSDCGHVEATEYTISQLKPDEEPEFSGGKSDGGGATGKW